MKSAELIEKLKELPTDYDITLDGCFYNCPIEWADIIADDTIKEILIK